MSDPTLQEPDAGGSLRQAAVSGMVWTGSRALLNRGLSLISFIVLARLLAPRDYGVVTLANVFVALFSVLASSGYSQALIQREKVDRQDLDTIFWIALATSLGLALLLVGAAWPLAAVFDEPRLRPILQVLSVTFIFIGLGSTHQAVLQRRLAFRTIATANVTANLIATVVGIGFAVLGFGPWALVIQTILTMAITTAIVTVRSGYRPTRYVSLERFRSMFEFSRNSLGTSLLAWLNTRTDDFLIGSFIGSRALGIYTVGYRVVTVLVEVLTLSVRQVAFPTFSRMQGDRVRLLRAYQSATSMCAVVAVPVFLFCAAAAPQIVLFVFGAKWERSIPVMQILCLFGAQHAIASFNYALLTGMGRAKTVFRISLASTALQILGFAIAVRLGIEWVAATFVVRAYLVLPFGLTIAARALDSNVRQTLAGVAAPVVSSLIMAAAVLAVADLGVGQLPQGVALVALAAVGAAVYLLALRLGGRQVLDEFVGYLRAAMNRRSVPA